MRLLVEVTDEQAAWLVLRAQKAGLLREEPRKRWTERERKEFARASIQAILVEVQATEGIQ